MTNSIPGAYNEISFSSDDIAFASEDNFYSPNTRKKRRGKYKAKKTKMIDRKFICWDGEGGHNPNGAQDYVLLGNSMGNVITAPALHTNEMLNFMIEQGEAYGEYIHVGFAFDYDVNMILQDFTPEQFTELRDKEFIQYGPYLIQHIPHKWIQVTREDTTIRIADVFGFFQTSFLKAIKTYIPESPNMAKLETVEAGKAARNTFTYAQIDMIRKYWEVEIMLLLDLVNKLRKYLYDAGFMITSWHGPGALANYIYRTNGIKKHKNETAPAIYDASRYAYAGGRFELYNLGRHEKVYSYDINSAYPYAITKLPSLRDGQWRHVDRPTNITEYGLYHIVSDIQEYTIPSPLFHRDHNGSMVYSWTTEGWYWSPDAMHAIGIPGVKIIEAYEYVGSTIRPFDTFVPDYYKIRKRHKAAGNGVQMAYKLGLNSMYGKMAQRVGGHDGPPEWHQLEWAGYVTSYTRSMLYDLIGQIPYEKLVAVETDGLYTTATPEELGLTDSEELGGWEIKCYDEMLYLQSGMYAYRVGDTWGMKYRGLDKGTLTPDSLAKVFKSTTGSIWPTITGPTTRFIGYRSALTHTGQFADYHRHWITSDKTIKFGQTGKRLHIPDNCPACKLGKNAYDMPHRLSISLVKDLQSKRHDIPWLDSSDNAAAWRQDSEWDHRDGWD